MNWILILLSSIISAILYRAGGMDKGDITEPKWIPKWLRQSWVRDWLCPAALLFAVCFFWAPYHWLSWVMLLLFYGLSGGALSTYWDELFGYDNFWFHGFMCGLAGIPLIWFGIPWQLLVIRVVVCTIGMGLWSKIIDKDYVEEMGRGVFFIL